MIKTVVIGDDLASISAALSFRVCVPPREEPFGGGTRAPFPNSGWWSSLVTTFWVRHGLLHFSVINYFSCIVCLYVMSETEVRHGLLRFPSSHYIFCSASSRDCDVGQTRAAICPVILRYCTNSTVIKSGTGCYWSFRFIVLSTITRFFSSRALQWCLGGAATLPWLLAPFSPHICWEW